MPWPSLPQRVHAALKGLCCLARTQGPVRAQELARCAGIPPAQAAKILYLLTWGGFVSSRRGSKGGFWLRIPSHRIRVQAVVDFFQPPDDRERKDSKDPVLKALQKAASPSRRAFQELTLADLVGDSRQSQSPKEITHNWCFFA